MKDIELLNKINSFDKSWCYQYQRRLDTLEEDKETLGWDDEFISNIKLDDFVFNAVTTKDEKEECKEFIKRYEWLGTIGQFPTHWFTARYNGILGGVVIFGKPNSLSKLLGEDTKNIESLISRGASASWCPKNLASKFIAWCMRWMVDNTQYRIFTAYSDPQAKERGVIYKSLNFFYLGQGNGGSIRCVHPYDKTKLISDRTFRARSFYKRYCKDLGIEPQPNWFDRSIVLWENIPDDIEKRLRDYSKEMYAKSEKIMFPKKRKWVYILGKDKGETKYLRKKFLERNKVFEYPND